MRRRIWLAALNGNPTLLIFLAEQYLGIADQALVKIPATPNQDKQGPDLSRLRDEELEQL